MKHFDGITRIGYCTSNNAKINRLETNSEHRVCGYNDSGTELRLTLLDEPLRRVFSVICNI